MIKYIHIVLVIWFFAAVSIGIAETFQNRPTLSGLNETVNQAIVCGNAVIERDVVVNRNQSFFPYCGHGQSYFASLQQELEVLSPMYIDHDNGPLTDAGDNFLYFTLDNWRAAAGLNANGFRRSTDGSSFSYGQMQSGDIIGPWIFDDLQKGFGALKWVAGSLGWTPVSSGNSGASIQVGQFPVWGNVSPYWNDLKDDTESAWPGGGSSGSPAAYTEGSLWHDVNGDGSLYLDAGMLRRQATPTCSAATIPHIVVLYMRGEKLFDWAWDDPIVYSDHGDGITESESFYIQEASDEETGALWTGETIGQSNSNLPSWCDQPPYLPNQLRYSFLGYVSYGLVLIQYTFTNE